MSMTGQLGLQGAAAAGALLLATLACMPVLQVPTVSNAAVAEEARRQRELAIELYHARRVRLAGVAARLRIGGVDLCGEQVGPYYGLRLLSLSDIREDFREAIASVLGISDEPTVELIDPGSPADRAGLQQGWQVARVNDRPVSNFTEVELAIADAAGGPLKLELSGSQAGATVVVEPVSACSFPVLMQTSDSVNAFADGRRVVISSGMMKFVESEDELALVVGHEMAHNVLEHVQKQQGNYVLGRLLGLLVDAGAAAAGVNTGRTGEAMGAALGATLASKGFEAESDYMGAYLAARSGYPISGAPMLWRRMAVEHPSSIQGGFMASHPSTPERFIALEQTVAEIERRLAAGEELEPLRREP